MTGVPAITLWEPWASFVAAGTKPYEFRRWSAPPWLWGKRIAIQAGARRAAILDEVWKQVGSEGDAGWQ